MATSLTSRPSHLERAESFGRIMSRRGEFVPLSVKISLVSKKFSPAE